MYHFDVLTEAWIPAVRPDGSGFSCGVLELLEHAHELSEISCDSPLETYAVQRFLIAFLMDAYRLKRLKDRKNLYEQGSFDMRVINDYIDLCRSEGVSFDLFDKERPFMQARYEAELDEKNRKSVANLFPEIPSGNNHVHFNHGTEDTRSYSASECMRGLLVAQIFAVQGGRGYMPSINGISCYYVLVSGNNLFQMLVLNMLSIGELDASLKNQGDSMPVLWRNTIPITPVQTGSISVLSGLIWPCRRIILIPSEDGKIRNIYYSAGLKYDHSLWKFDPHVSYVMTKDGDMVPCAPRESRAVWRDIGGLLLSDSTKVRSAAVVCSAKEFLGSEYLVRARVYGVLADRASYICELSGKLELPCGIVYDFDRSEELRSNIGYIEDVAEKLYKAIRECEQAKLYADEKTKSKRNCPISTQAQQAFFAQMHIVVFSEYIPILSELDVSVVGWNLDSRRYLTEKAQCIARSIALEYAGRFGTTARDLEEQARAMGKLNAALIKLKKGRE